MSDFTDAIAGAWILLAYLLLIVGINYGAYVFYRSVRRGEGISTGLRRFFRTVIDFWS